MPATPSTNRRRNHEKDAKTRELLVDAAVEILRSEGFSAVSARRVASSAGLSHQIVHYYFQSMEELLLEVIHRASEIHLQALKNARASEQPMWTAWALINKKDSGRLETEYLGIANRYASAQESLRHFRARYREELVALVMEALERHKLKLGPITPSMTATAVHAIARTMALEAAHGTADGHAEMRTFIEGYLLRLEGPCRISHT